MPDVTQPRYFQLDTRDSTFQARTMYVAWDAGTAVVFTRSSDDRADDEPLPLGRGLLRLTRWLLRAVRHRRRPRCQSGE
jgi:hypothetical protein